MEDLIEKAKCGSVEAFTEIVLIIEKELYKIAKNKLKNEEDALDAIQNTLMYAYKAIRNLKHNNYFKTWIIKILINECNKIYIRINIERKLVSTKNEYYSDDSIDEKLNFIAICKNLNEEEKRIIFLYYNEKYTDKEIGKLLSLNKNSVKTKRHRAKNKIKKYIKTIKN